MACPAPPPAAGGASKQAVAVGGHLLVQGIPDRQRQRLPQCPQHAQWQGQPGRDAKDGLALHVAAVELDEHNGGNVVGRAPNAAIRGARRGGGAGSVSCFCVETAVGHKACLAGRPANVTWQARGRMTCLTARSGRRDSVRPARVCGGAGAAARLRITVEADAALPLIAGPRIDTRSLCPNPA